jgi:predicted dinucleotide-binding enzyme
VKKTIAIIGGVDIGAAIAHKVSAGNYRLLLVSNEINHKSQIVQNIKQNNLNAEVEIVDCAKEGCWEADIIVLAIPFHELKEVIKKINEVVTQKIVLIISNENQSLFSFDKAQALQQLLPYSRVVAASSNPYSHETIISSNDKETSETILKMIMTAVISQ